MKMKKSNTHNYQFLLVPKALTIIYVNTDQQTDGYSFGIPLFEVKFTEDNAKTLRDEMQHLVALLTELAKSQRCSASLSGRSE